MVRDEMGKFIKGHNGFWLGKKRIGLKGRKMSQKTKEKLKKINTGKKLSEKTKQKISKIMIGKKYRLGFKVSEETKNKIRQANLGKQYSLETRKKLSEALRGEKSPLWKGGISRNNYPFDWIDSLRESIRQRDGFICQICGIHQDELNNGRIKKLDIHHIDYNKDNINIKNLITLCRNCHIKTNFRREYWINYFLNKI